jgi:iron complex transport system substrate-binding protein
VIRLATLLLATLVAACGVVPSAAPEPAEGATVPLAAARTFRVVERDGYRIVDLESSIVSWAGVAHGPRQRARIVLVPHGRPAPLLAGDLAGATLIRTPVRRIATNAGPHEAMLTALGVDDRLVAVGGTFSYNDDIRARVMAKQVAQVGYGWHSPPQLDVLVAARPDVFLMALDDADHLDHLERIRALGIAVMPTFIDGEPDYMGRVDYVRLVGMLTGREREADAYVAMVARNVDRLKALAATQPPRPMLAAYYLRGDRWLAVVRNAGGKLIRDAGGINLLEQPDDLSRDEVVRLGTEQLLPYAERADCWVLRDDQSPRFRDASVPRRFRAWREGCAYAVDGSTKPHVNAYDFYERAVIRPDLVLADLIAMLHPHLGIKAGTYIRPDRLGAAG